LGGRRKNRAKLSEENEQDFRLFYEDVFSFSLASLPHFLGRISLGTAAGRICSRNSRRCHKGAVGERVLTLGAQHRVKL